MCAEICADRQLERTWANTQVRNHEKPFTCSYPGRVRQFITKSNLKTHDRTHTREQPYTCSYPGCVRKLTTKGKLKIHERTHIGEKPYTCNYPGCVRKFTTKCILKVHERRHTCEKPYTCSYPGCVRKFAQIGNLKEHQQTHTGEKPYTCSFPGCAQQISQRTIWKHMSERMILAACKSLRRTTDWGIMSASTQLGSHTPAVIQDACEKSKKELHASAWANAHRWNLIQDAREHLRNWSNWSTRNTSRPQVKSHTHAVILDAWKIRRRSTWKFINERTQGRNNPYTCSYPRCVRKFAREYNVRTHERTHTGNKNVRSMIIHQTIFSRTHCVGRLVPAVKGRVVCHFRSLVLTVFRSADCGPCVQLSAWCLRENILKTTF